MFNFLTTQLGSVPYPTLDGVMQKLTHLDVPSWPQLPRRTFRENMYAQYSPTLPAIHEDALHEKVFFDTSRDISDALETFYTHILSDDLDAFALQPDYACGFPALIESLAATSGTWAKGQVTGPISFGLTVTDQELRASLYDELLADAILKNTARSARWQLRELKKVRPNVVIFLDEPYLAAFGSAFVSLSRQQVTTALDEVFDAIQLDGGVSGVHCCANTDWGLLLDTKVDILNLDAYGYMQNLALYPRELREFLDRGGSICWGIVPNNEQVYQESAAALAERLRSGMRLISAKAAARGVRIEPAEFASRSLIAPACGLGSTTPAVADRVYEVLEELGQILQRDL